jgi:hypothetical protein
MRLATDRSRQTLKPASFCTSPRLAVIRLAPRTDQLRSVPLGSMVLDAFGALGIAAAAASLQGFYPSAGWGHRRRISPRAASLALLGLILPGAFPFPGLGLSAATLGLTTVATTPYARVCRKAEAASARPPLAFREGTLLGTVPCASSFKDPGNRLASCETAGP